MMNLTNMKPHLAALTLALGSLSVTVPARAAVDMYDGAWHFSLTPYVWLANVNGSIDSRISGLRGYDGDASLSAKIGPNDYLENLKFGAMLTGEVRKGDWSIFTDFIYIDFGDQRSRVRDITGPDGRPLTAINRDVTTSLSSTVWTLAGAYTVARNPRG